MSQESAVDRGKLRRVNGHDERGFVSVAGSRPRLTGGVSALLMLLAVIGLSACRSSNVATAPSTVNATPTAVPMIVIVTPTPAKPGAVGAGATATTAAGATLTPDQSTNGQNGSYTVQPGDSLYGIAVRFNVSVQALMEANSISDPSSIQAGQVLVIP